MEAKYLMLFRADRELEVNDTTQLKFNQAMETRSTLDCSLVGTAKAHFEEHMKSLRKQYHLILQLEQTEEFLLNKEQKGILRTKTSVMRYLDLLEKLHFSSTMYEQYHVQNSRGFRRKEDETKEGVEEKLRYLCISNGFEIWCIDLKQEQEEELKPVEERVAVSAGLFKWGSNVYMIGGMEGLQSEATNLDSVERYISLRHSFCDNVKGSSLDTYRLSLADDGASLVCSKFSDIEPLNQHKFWPIVEKINGEIHVIDSFPYTFLSDIDPPRFFSHEVLKLGGGNDWKVMETIKYEVVEEDDDDETWGHWPYYIFSHVVVGTRIYALSRRYYLVFDSETGRWDKMPRDDYRFWKDPFSARQVWHIPENAKARCAGTFPLCEGKPSLYVILAITDDISSFDEEYLYGMVSVAYLVTLTGDVVCFQRLPLFSKKLFMSGGTIINVDEDEEGKTMCAIVRGTTWTQEGWEFLVIRTFRMEVLSANVSIVEHILEAGMESGWPVEQDFLRLVVKDDYAFRTSNLKHTPTGDFDFSSTMQACFL